MIKALDTASQGMLQAERRATDVAKDILNLSAEGASFSLEGIEDAQDFPSDTAQSTQAASTGPGTTPSSSAGYGNLIQQFADLRAEEQAFKANAKVFKSLDETYDKALGSLLDDKG